MSPIRNIIFDFGGVLLDLAPERCRAAFRRLGFSEIDQLLGMAHQKGVLDLMERGLTTTEAFCDELRRRIGDLSLTDEALLTAWRSMADGIPAWRLHFVKHLKDEGYHVAALSNTNTVHWDWCRPMFLEAGYQPEQLFEHVWLSYQLHLAKPDPEIFSRILQLSGYVPSESLFVDDSPANCAVAASLGLRTFAPPFAVEPKPGGERVVADWREALSREVMASA